MPKPVHESARTLSEVTTSDEAGLLEVEFITPGWGSSGYYSPKVVQEAAPLFAVGTHMYFDHPSASDNADRPERSVRDLAAVIETAGTVHPTTGGVRGKVRPLKAYSELLTDEAFAKNVGLSIRGSASDIVIGEADGRRGPIIESLADLSSVDFVTRAGRGGSVLAVLESANLLEATASDRMSQLRDVIRAEYHGPGVWAYVSDMDAEAKTFQFEVNREDGPSVTYEQGYSVGANDVDVTLTGEPLEVRRVTNYVPVTRPDSTTPTTTESTEDNMAKIQIEEADHTRLNEKAGRVDALESENATLKAEKAKLEEAEAARIRADRARELVAESATEAGVEFSPREIKGFLADITLTEGGEFDEKAFTALVEADATAKKAAGTSTGGGLTGFGASAQSTDVAESARPTTNAWGRPLAESKGA